MFKYNITLHYVMFEKMNIKIATDLEELEYLLEDFKKSEKNEEMIDISDIQACYFNNVISMIENMNLKYDIIRFDKFVFLKVLKT